MVGAVPGINTFAFRARFPEFNVPTVYDADIQNALNTAQLWVDPNIWFPNDYVAAYLFMAAHILALAQMSLESSALGGAGSLDLFIRSIGIGERRVMIGERRGFSSVDKMAGPGEALLGYTQYGMNYLMLRSRNVPAVATV